jgi:UDP-GlcNAc:undecaprenyl-phosphate GlcNAc-1-phosphate transferase
VAGFLLFGAERREVYPILAWGSFLFAVGLFDDFRHVKPYAKLTMQLFAAAGTVYFGLHLPWTAYAPINALITMLWLVGITNAINLLDNMDGLAAGISVIACVFLAMTFVINGQTAESILPVLVAGAVLGFLVFNFYPASIFMGDSGSMFLGFVLAGFSLLSDYGRSRNLFAVLATPVLILLIPIFDTCVVSVTRRLSGRRVSQGGRDHTSHRLVALGMSERRAVLHLYALATLSGLWALVVRLLAPEMALLMIPAFALIIVFLGLFLGKVRIYEREHIPDENTILRSLQSFLYKRRMFEVLLDLVLVTFSYYGAFLLRFDGQLPDQQLLWFASSLPVVIAIQMMCFLTLGVYRGVWKYFGVDDLIVIGRSVVVGSVITFMAASIMYLNGGPPQSTLVLHTLLLFVLVTVSRLSFRLLSALIIGKHHHGPGRRSVIIYGAGDGGALVIRELLNNPSYDYVPVGFVDDDGTKVGRFIYGYPVYDRRRLRDVIREHGVEEMVVSSGQIQDPNLEDVRRMGLRLRRMSFTIN